MIKKQTKMIRKFNGILKKDYKVRTFLTFSIPEKTENLLLGSKLIKYLVTVFSIPEDICIQEYTVPTTKENIAVP